MEENGDIINGTPVIKHREFTKFDHLVKVDDIPAAEIYSDLRLYIPKEHRKKRLQENKLAYLKRKKSRIDQSERRDRHRSYVSSNY